MQKNFDKIQESFKLLLIDPEQEEVLDEHSAQGSVQPKQHQTQCPVMQPGRPKQLHADCPFTDDTVLEVSLHAALNIGVAKNTFVLSVKIGYVVATALVDSGSKSTFVSPDMAAKLPVAPVTTPKFHKQFQSSEA
ncbi:hypothetical protein D1007_45481 [Hordeum vulgare]|nr:hypothetical protein D1007_45481 [Hordeum vulgare]